jgi:hypothetical protein
MSERTRAVPPLLPRSLGVLKVRPHPLLTCQCLILIDRERENLSVAGNQRRKLYAWILLTVDQKLEPRCPRTRGLERTRSKHCLVAARLANPFWIIFHLVLFIGELTVITESMNKGQDCPRCSIRLYIVVSAPPSTVRCRTIASPSMSWCTAPSHQEEYECLLQRS